MRSHEQVLRVDAPCHVAAMADMQAVGDWAVVNDVRKPMNAYGFAFNREIRVSPRRLAIPDPAAVRVNGVVLRDDATGFGEWNRIRHSDLLNRSLMPRDCANSRRGLFGEMEKSRSPKGVGTCSGHDSPPKETLPHVNDKGVIQLAVVSQLGEITAIMLVVAVAKRPKGS